MSHFSAQFIEDRRRALVMQRIDLRGQLESLGEDGTPEAGGDIADRTELEQSKRARADSQARIMRDLAEVDAAITRIQRGTYGVCELSGVPISEARLEAMPTARFDITAQVKSERLQRRASPTSPSWDHLVGHF